MTIKWGAEIPCKGRPDWLKDDEICAIYQGEWLGDGGEFDASFWTWDAGISAIKLRADHPRYRDTASAIATLEAAGYTVTSPDPYEALMNALAYEKDMIWTGDVLAMLRRAIPDAASIDMTALAKGA